MSNKITELTLNLQLIKDIDVQNNNIDNQNTQAWLENDDPTLLGENAKAASSQQLAIDHTISVEQIKIRQTETGFNLITETATLELKDQDIIKVATQYYQVQIIQEYIVPVEQQEERFYDTLTLDYYNQECIEQDPLSFLYGEQPKQHALQYNSYDAFSQTNQKTLPYDQVPTLNSHIAGLAQQNTVIDQRRTVSQAQFQAQQGNILKDLDINEQSATITYKKFDAGKSSFADQSPADMIDEYLTMQEYALAPEAYQQNDNFFKKIVNAFHSRS